MLPSRSSANRPPREAGYVLLGILLAVTLMLVALAAVVPRMATQIKRDREEELIRRGNQYAKAIKKYYKKWGRYPTSIEQLENTNNIRFLRKRYKDPITGKDEWRLIRFGQQKTQPRTFGRSGSGVGTPAAQLPGAQQPGGQIGTQPGGQIGQQIGQQIGSGAPIGGGPIVGVSSLSEDESLKELNGKNHYNEWEFVYDPRFDPAMQQQGMPGQQIPGQPGFPGPGQPGQQPGPQGPAGPGGGRSNFPPTGPR